MQSEIERDQELARLIEQQQACPPLHVTLDDDDFVTPDDIRKVATAALRHRIALAPEMEIEAYRPDDLLRDILERVSAPRQ